jgi:Zn-dependent protease
MDSQNLIDGLLMYLGLLVLLTFHEFGHAWTAQLCGDDTARLQGRVSLNPLVHIDPIGTVLLPLIGLFTGFFIGWAKPVPVNPYNLRHPKRDDLLVTLAGPGMNVLLAIVLVGLMRVGFMIHSNSLIELCLRLAELSLLLCFFNLIPIPPLDGSQVLRVLTNMSYETYHNFARFGFLIVIVLLQFPPLSHALMTVTQSSLYGLMSCFGMSA